MTVDREFLIALLSDLVGINSINPRLVEGAPGEERIGGYIAGQLRRLGAEVEVQELEPGRVNVTGIFRGSSGGKTLMFNGHMDTVGVDGMSDPFAATLRDGRLYGRGAQDMKGGLAAMLGAMKCLVDDGIRLKGDLIFTAVADEEHGSIGTEAIVKNYQADAAIVAEPTNLDVCLAHKGFSVFEIETRGRAAHGARYQEGIDANLHMGRVLAALDTLAGQLPRRDPHPLVGPPSLLVPLVKGGTHQFIYPDSCRISVERRTIPGEGAESIALELENILEKLRAEDEQFHAGLKTIMSRNPHEISQESEIVKILSGEVSSVLAKPPGYVGHDWWEDSALLGVAGIETVIIGPTGSGIHTQEEWVDIQSVIDLAQILAQTAATYCSRGQAP